MRRSIVPRFLASSLVLTLLLGVVSARGGSGASVVGVVRMPDVCSPSISPAVVYLTSADRNQPRATIAVKSAAAPSIPSSPTEVALVHQRDLQFVPRVQAIAIGETIRFTNQDGEAHNVHAVSPGFPFNQSMAPGGRADFIPLKSGVMKLACDIHPHMRGYVVVSPTPWVSVCDRAGRYRLDGVASGKYVLTAWHEMGDSVQTEIEIADAATFAVPELVLTSSVGPNVARSAAGSAPVRPWPDVIDRISVALAASREAASRPGELPRARRLADDAYWGEFEASDMETAVRKYLGFGRAGAIERQFLAIRSAARDVAEKRKDLAVMAGLSRKLITDLLAAASELNARGVTDRSRIESMASHDSAG